MSTSSDSESWFERRLAAIHERFARGEIDEAMYQWTLEGLWRTYDNFIEYAPSAASNEATDVGCSSRNLADGMAA